MDITNLYFVEVVPLYISINNIWNCLFSHTCIILISSLTREKWHRITTLISFPLQLQGCFSQEAPTWCNLFYLCILILTQGYVYWVEREKHRLFASHMHSDWGSILQPRYVPWPGFEPTIFWCTGWCSNQLSHPVRAGAICFSYRDASRLRVGGNLATFLEFCLILAIRNLNSL